MRLYEIEQRSDALVWKGRRGPLSFCALLFLVVGVAGMFQAHAMIDPSWIGRGKTSLFNGWSPLLRSCVWFLAATFLLCFTPFFFLLAAGRQSVEINPIGVHTSPLFLGKRESTSWAEIERVEQSSDSRGPLLVFHRKGVIEGSLEGQRRQISLAVMWPYEGHELLAIIHRLRSDIVPASEAGEWL